jgi:hypothetical protein
MRTTHISPEFNYNQVNGTLSQLEKKSFFSSKLMKFTDTINILNSSIVYYQNANGEQLNLDIEKNLTPIIYNTDNDKENYKFAQTNNTEVYTLFIDLKQLLIDYLFAIIKTNRTFEGISNAMVLSNSTNSAIVTYISNNLLSRYNFDHLDLFIMYNDLNNGSLKYINTFNPYIGIDNNLTNKYASKTDVINNTYTITFTQEKPSNQYSFDYYFNIYFTKI